MIAVDEAGHLINPLIVEGQVHGRLRASALVKQIVHDGDGQPPTGSFMDYALPPPADPRVELDDTVTPTRRQPLGQQQAAPVRGADA